MARSNDLVHLHAHSEFSILDGCGKQDDYIDYAKHLGHPAVCFTEHGTLRGAYKLHETTNIMGGIKPIYAIEFYMALNHLATGLPAQELADIRGEHENKTAQNKAIRAREKQLNIKRRYHSTVLAKDDIGLKNLYKLSTVGWVDGFYSRPRIDFDLLEKYGDGLIVLSGCMAGYICAAILEGRFDQALKLVDRFRNRWGDDFYIEIMPNSLPEQVKLNLALAQIARATGVPMVATADVHYMLKSDWEAHEVLLCVNTKKKMSDPERWTFGTREFWFQTRREMEGNFATCHPGLPERDVWAALDQTVKIADKCTAAMDIDRFRALSPDLIVPKEHVSEFQWLLHLCLEGWDRRDIPKRAAALAKKRGVSLAEVMEEYADRLALELKMIEMKKAVTYFLIIWDLYAWVRGQGIVCGPGRGSAGGSLVSYLIALTDVDPVEHGLIFERFMNPDRIDMPDIDCDFEDRRRQEIVEWLRERWGQEKVSQISTVTRMTGKACLRDLSRVLDVPPGEVDAVVKSIVLRSSGDERESQTIEDAMVEFDVGRAFNESYPDVLRLAKRLEGQARGLGLHAAGVIVAGDELTDWVPLETRAHNGKRVTCTAFDMMGAEAQGLMKIDVLGLRTLSVISDALQAIKERTGEEIDLNWIDLGDQKTLDNFTAGNFVGVFQFDTASAEKICEGVTFDRFDDIPAMVALDRPGTARSGLATQYLERKGDPSKRVSIHPLIDRICDDTLGIIVYQEHVIKIFIEVAGFAPGTADSLRKAIAKKWGDEKLGKERENFVAGAVSRGFPEPLAEKIFEQIKFFGSYGFNKSHATAYGLISYWEMWLKTYYPRELMWGLLANEPDRARMMKLVREARRLGVEVIQPNVSTSGERFTITEGAIQSGLVELKGVGSAAVTSIVANQPYKSFKDFIDRIDLRRCHKGVITALAKSGALVDLIPNTRWFLENMEKHWDRRKTLNWDKLLKESMDFEQFSDDDKTMTAAEVSPLAFGKHPIEVHSDFLDAAPVDWVSLEDDAIWDLKWAWAYGTMVELRYNQVGDFHSGKDPTDAEKARKKWGARYANVNLEDASGVNKRIKVDHDIFSSVREVVDKGAGWPVAALVTVNKRWKSLRVKIFLDVVELRRKAEAGEPWTPLEQALFEPGKLFEGHKKNDLTRKMRRAKQGSRQKLTGVCLIAAFSDKLDKNDNEMGFITVYGRGGAYETVAFASVWPEVKGEVAAGRLVKMTVTVSDSGGYFVESVQSL